MNKLELCQRLRREARISGGANTPPSVVGQTGEMQSIVDWIDDAYRNIQAQNPYWEFLRLEYSYNTIAGIQTYTRDSAGYPELHIWKVDDPDGVRNYITSDGVGTEQWMTDIGWEEMKNTRLFGNARLQTGRPTEYCIKPDNSMVMWPIPDNDYTVVGEYYRVPFTMVGNTDTPIFDSHYHMAIVWEALRYTGAYQSAPEKYQHGDTERDRIEKQMVLRYLPKFSVGEPLA